MASSSKPTGVHYALIIVIVVLTIPLGVFLLMAYKGSGSISELKSLNADLKKKADTSDAALKKALGDLDAIKKTLGASFTEVGADDPGNVNSVIGDMTDHMKKYGQGLTSPTYNDLIAKMGESLKALTKARDDLQAQLASELATFEQQKTELNAMLAAEKSGREQADKGKTDADSLHSEELKAKEKDIAELRDAINSTQQEYDEYKDAAEKLKKSMEQRIANLQAINRKLADEVDEVKRDSFEIADGEIIWVDAVAKRVWINLGSNDNLRPRTSFSVYKKNNSGVGRAAVKGSTGPEDIKGAIEVTRILNANQAEARILDEDSLNPIGKGDQVYSPLWSSGRGESFSIVGIADLDGDGRSDREMLHELIGSSGATIDNEVDDKGTLYVNGEIPEENKPRLTEKTKFLVKGKIPDIGSTADQEQQAIISKINELQKEMDQQARERAIRVVSLSDFLSFMGYRTQRRLFVPGGETPYTIKDGARAASVEQKSSTGNTSGVYSNDKSRRPGRSSKVFRNGAGNN